ncbi:MAG: hypothetical protein IPK32_15100 [Verrucomicrobiaceae bacterium]|nr:hypothetical protein [Verrucomicrobiaceae bacterium]
MLNRFFRRFRPSQPKPEAVSEQSGHMAHGPVVTISFSSARRSWNEAFDLRDMLLSTLVEKGFAAEKSPDGDVMFSGYVFRPELSSFQPLDDGEGSRSCTIISFDHSGLGCHRCFEWQHSIGETLEEACRVGFEKWCKTDLVALLDATRNRAEDCTCMEMAFPNRSPGKRCVFSPVEIVANPASDLDLINSSDPDSHSFCPCCLTTACMKELKPYIEGTGFTGVRYFVMRDNEGNLNADCRVNGLEFDPGKAALIRYAESWPGTGFQYRKQYVVVHDHSS